MFFKKLISSLRELKYSLRTQNSFSPFKKGGAVSLFIIEGNKCKIHFQPRVVTYFSKGINLMLIVALGHIGMAS